MVTSFHLPIKCRVKYIVVIFGVTLVDYFVRTPVNTFLKIFQLLIPLTQIHLMLFLVCFDIFPQSWFLHDKQFLRIKKHRILTTVLLNLCWTPLIPGPQRTERMRNPGTYHFIENTV